MLIFEAIRKYLTIDLIVKCIYGVESEVGEGFYSVVYSHAEIKQTQLNFKSN